MFLHKLNTLEAGWIAVDVWSNSSRCRQESVYKSWTWCLYNDQCLDIVMIIWSSINCPTVICSPTIWYFSREKPLVKPTGLGSLLHYICLCDLFSFAFIFRSIKPKIQKYLAEIYFISRSHAIYLSNYYNSLTLFANCRRRCPKGIDNPFNTLGCEYLLFVCKCCLHSVAWFSYWFDNLGLITEEIPTVAVLHHPFLFGELPT